jgi:hypothetical protein
MRLLGFFLPCVQSKESGLTVNLTVKNAIKNPAVDFDGN